MRNRFNDQVMNTNDPSLNLSASDKFHQFYVIIDRLNSEMEKRSSAYKIWYERFNFLIETSLPDELSPFNYYLRKPKGKK